MHILQPKHIKLKSDEVEKLLTDLNISLSQLPKIKINDPALPEGCNVSDLIKIEDKQEFLRRMHEMHLKSTWAKDKDIDYGGFDKKSERDYLE